MKGNDINVIEHLKMVGKALNGLNEDPKVRKSVLEFARDELGAALSIVQHELEESENDSNSRSNET